MKHFLRSSLSLLLSFVLLTAAFSQNGVSVVVTDQWSGSAWNPYVKGIYSYDISCRLTTALIQKWQSGTSTYADSLLITTSYDGNNRKSQDIFQVWNTSTTTWDNLIRMTYSYNADNLVATILTDLWFSANWKATSRDTYSYNADKTINQILTEIGGGPWINGSRRTYSYNGDKTVNTILGETWAAIKWSKSTLNTFAYNGQGKELTDLTQTWGSGQWNNSQLNTNTYDGGGLLTSSLNQKWNSAGSNWVDDTRNTYTYGSCTLPVLLSDFSVSMNGKAANLKWASATEINSKDFTIQRSRDGVAFENIGTVNASGNTTNKTNYQFTDAGALQAGVSKVFYRLQMNDKDGKFSFSKTISVTIIPVDKMVAAYPNPVKDRLSLTFNIAAATVNVKIIDQNGKAVHLQQFTNVQPGSAQNINTAALKAGVYFVQWSTGNDVQSIKIVKY